MDLFNIEQGMIGVVARDLEARLPRGAGAPRSLLRELRGRPEPRHGGVRELERAVEELGVKAATAFPAGLTPQVPINDKKFYPLYAKCIELDIPIFVNAGVPGPRVPMALQDVALIDEVCWFFPELKFVTRHGCEPWTDLAVKLLLKWPNLYYSTSAFAPKYYPKDIVDFANTRGADKVMYAGYYPMGLTLERIFKEMPDVPFRDHVWPKFLRENALRLFGLNRREQPVRGSARAGGVVDTAVGFPKSREEMFEFYEFIRKGSHDQQTKEGGLEFPAGYMFKDVPEVGSRRHRAIRSLMLARRARRGTASRRRSSASRTTIGQRAVRDFPDRFFAEHRHRPERGHGSGPQDRPLRERVRPASAVGAFPVGPVPAGRARTTRCSIPIYAKCIELDIAFCSTAGVPGPATAVRAAGRRATSTRSAGSSPS